jgi:hypothetical protein
MIKAIHVKNKIPENKDLKSSSQPSIHTTITRKIMMVTKTTIKKIG